MVVEGPEQSHQANSTSPVCSAPTPHPNPSSQLYTPQTSSLSLSQPIPPHNLHPSKPISTNTPPPPTLREINMLLMLNPVMPHLHPHPDPQPPLTLPHNNLQTLLRLLLPQHHLHTPLLTYDSINGWETKVSKCNVRREVIIGQRNCADSVSRTRIRL